MSFIQYLRDTKGELKHVSWPTNRQAVTFTAFVVAISIFTAVYLGAFDTLFTSLIKNYILQ